MKTTFLIASTILLLASCKKDRTCSCTYADGTLYSEGTILNSTKKDAKNLCTTTVQNVTCIVK